jgi:leucyl/phenylalanyl-tRNA--protein transferase
MPVWRLSQELAFPPPEGADPSGVVAVGGDLRPERLLLAYSQGIFPWPAPGLPLLWHSPDPRMVLRPRELRVSRSLRKTLRRGCYRVSLDRAFGRVIRACAEIPRPGQDGTWITPEMTLAYEELHARGFAHSAEAWLGEELAGGLYGLSLGGCFFGESMFALRPDASKVAFATLVRKLAAWDFDLVDCQIHTEHLARLGAREWSRARFLRALRRSLARPTRRGRWTLGAERPGEGLAPEERGSPA